MNIWSDILGIIPFDIRTGTKVLQASGQEFGKALHQLMGASSGLGIP